MLESEKGAAPEPDAEDLRTEYTQAGEEARYRHQLMQNSYYLILILNGAFAGALFGQWNEGNLEVVLAGGLLASVSILFLSVTLVSNGSKRGAAWARRLYIEARATDHDLFRIQQDTLHHRAQFQEQDGDYSYQPRDKTRLESLESKWIPYVFGLNALCWFVLAAWSGYQLIP